MISVIAWVPKGASKSVPSVAELPTKEEIEEMINSGALDGGAGSDAEMGDRRDAESKSRIHDEDEDDSNDDIEDDDGDEGEDDAQKPSNDDKLDSIADGLKELDMDNYDEEEDNAVDLFKGASDLYYPSNALDPYLKNKDEDEDSEDMEDLTINPTDSVIVCSKNDDDGHQIEVWVCEDTVEDGINTYVHHEIMAYDFILCMAWMDCPLNGGDKGNFMAVGSMGPGIEIWDLDVVDAVQPCKVLGGIEQEKRKKGKKKVIYKEGSHTDSVLGLAWNKQYRNVLASASADHQVKIWDVAAGKCNITMEHHTDKVQAVAWNPHEPQVLLSGSFDHTVVMRDGRDSAHPGHKWAVESDVESLAWDPHNKHMFVVSLADGTVKGFDIRTATSDPTIKSKPSFTIHAHDKAVCSVSYNPAAPNLLATGSEDKSVKLWDLSNNQPSCIASKNPKAGAVFSLAFSEDNPFLLALGGSKGRLEMWDVISDASISKRFGNYNTRKC